MEISAAIDRENLTVLEKQALQALVNGLYAEPGFSDVDAHDIAHDIKVSTHSVRGALSSLVKKDYISIDDPGVGYQIVYLNENRWYLHPEWIVEYDARQYGPMPAVSLG